MAIHAASSAIAATGAATFAFHLVADLAYNNPHEDEPDQNGSHDRLPHSNSPFVFFCETLFEVAFAHVGLRTNQHINDDRQQDPRNDGAKDVARADEPCAKLIYDEGNGIR